MNAIYQRKRVFKKKSFLKVTIQEVLLSILRYTFLVFITEFFLFLFVFIFKKQEFFLWYNLYWI